MPWAKLEKISVLVYHKLEEISYTDKCYQSVKQNVFSTKDGISCLTFKYLKKDIEVWDFLIMCGEKNKVPL